MPEPVLFLPRIQFFSNSLLRDSGRERPDFFVRPSHSRVPGSVQLPCGQATNLLLRDPGVASAQTFFSRFTLTRALFRSDSLYSLFFARKCLNLFYFAIATLQIFFSSRLSDELFPIVQSSRAQYSSSSTYPTVKSFFAQEGQILFQTIVFHLSKFSNRVVSSQNFLLTCNSLAPDFCLYRSLIFLLALILLHFVGAAEPPTPPWPHDSNFSSRSRFASRVPN
jgi:hypothetical protein